MSAEPNQVAITIHAPLPGDERATQALFKHLRELAAECEEAGWEAAVTLTLTKDRTED